MLGPCTDRKGFHHAPAPARPGPAGLPGQRPGAGRRRPEAALGPVRHAHRLRRAGGQRRHLAAAWPAGAARGGVPRWRAEPGRHDRAGQRGRRRPPAADGGRGAAADAGGHRAGP
ncbi:hypothetical protein G6F40_016813 [Rhizopus arrhizus]|nr:hypothetical protein G6F40_016813 [Rhizopus arrhizus]KAG1251308.1 hypothetical protein G6F68_012337 [Rhizopus microsporus]